MPHLPYRASLKPTMEPHEVAEWVGHWANSPVVRLACSWCAVSAANAASTLHLPLFLEPGGHLFLVLSSASYSIVTHGFFFSPLWLLCLTIPVSSLHKTARFHLLYLAASLPVSRQSATPAPAAGMITRWPWDVSGHHLRGTQPETG